MKLLIRCDASKSIGVGHLSRCLTLGRAFTLAGVEVAFAMAAPAPAVRQWVEGGEFPIHELEPTSLGKDLTITSRLLLDYSYDFCIVDGYHFTEGYIADLAQCGVWTCYMDDMINYYYACHAVFNQNFYSPAEKFRRPEFTDLILGPRFALLREEFAALGNTPRVITDKVQRVLVTMGGADPTMETEKVIAGLGQVDDLGRLEVRVVVGRANPRGEAIHRLLTKPDICHNYTVLESVSNMAEEMLAADIAISASGTTCMELLCAGLPSLVIVVVDNQMLIGPELEKRGLAVNLGWHVGVTPEQIARQFRELADDAVRRSEMSRRGREAVDGQGASRAVEAMLESYNRHKGGGKEKGKVFK